MSCRLQHKGYFQIEDPSCERSNTSILNTFERKYKTFIENFNSVDLS